MWGLAQNVGVGGLSTTCVCTNLPFLGIDVVEGGGWPRTWGLAQNVGVGGLSTTCVCTNLPFLGMHRSGGGGISPTNSVLPTAQLA